MPKAVGLCRSGCRAKHNRPLCGSNLGPLTPVRRANHSATETCTCLYLCCAEIDRCGPLPTILHAVAVPVNDSFAVGDTVHLRCRRGYTPRAHPPPATTASHPRGADDDVGVTSSSAAVASLVVAVTCLDDLTWSTPDRVCRSMRLCVVYCRLFIPSNFLQIKCRQLLPRGHNGQAIHRPVIRSPGE